MRSAVDIERGVFVTPSEQNQTSNLLDPSPSSTFDPALVLAASGKRTIHAGKKKYAKQVTGAYNGTELHLAAQRGDLASVKHIIDEINSQMVGTLSGPDFDADVVKIRACVVNEVNELGETAPYMAAENGHLEVVKELLKYSDQETLTRKSHLEFDPLHIAASQGHHAIVKLLLDHNVSLCKTISMGNDTPLITAASKGHTAVVQDLFSKDPTLLDISRFNGKNALHMAASLGHVETVKCLLEKDPKLVLLQQDYGEDGTNDMSKFRVKFGYDSKCLSNIYTQVFVYCPSKSDPNLKGSGAPGSRLPLGQCTFHSWQPAAPQRYCSRTRLLAPGFWLPAA
ncbi:hypothetical protein QVD17_31400 [Tagetes erecta]|uniref:Uncharacterized protein n=1 Tax=Tagetes erecta TaxID=13708 RepID=A0AAD8K7F9_TARER|nr:hypothetical protein QVD17_31400 [Tagetes erecta]